ncbi:MAG: hypothetical protein V6Z86_05650 [Hyphomicrobiales bacterium]
MTTFMPAGRTSPGYDILYDIQDQLVVYEAVSVRARTYLAASIASGVIMIGHTAFVHIDDLSDDLQAFWAAGLSVTPRALPCAA